MYVNLRWHIRATIVILLNQSNRTVSIVNFTYLNCITLTLFLLLEVEW